MAKKRKKLTGLGVEPTDRKEVRNLHCKLTIEEFCDRSTRLAQLEQEIVAAETARKQAADEHKAQLGGLTHSRSELAKIVRSQHEVRTVDCTWHADWAGKSMILRRDDTGEAVEARTMTPEEMQMGFGFTAESRGLPPPSDEPNPRDGLS